MDDIKENFTHWMIAKGKTKEEVIDVFVNKDGEIKTKKKNVLVMKTTDKDWQDFCEETGMDYEEVKLLANNTWIYNYK